MKKTLRNMFGILAFSAMIPVSAWAADAQPAAGGFRETMRQQAIGACAGKNAGDAVQLTTPRGNTVSAVCQEFDGKLAAWPKHKNRDSWRGGHGPGWGWPCCQAAWEAGAGPGQIGMGPGDDNCYMTKALKLTPEQKTAIREIMKTGHEKHAALREQLRNTRDNLRDAAMQSPYDEAAVRKIAAEREHLRTELIVSMSSAMNRAMELLTPEQKEQAARIGIFGHGMGPESGWGKGHGHKGFNRGKGHGHGMGYNGKNRLRDGRGPNPDCPLK